MTTKFDVLTLFPEMFSFFDFSLMGKAREKGLFGLNIVDIREFSKDKHKKCDDYPYGGGAGMIMMPEPIHNAVTATDPEHEAYRIFMSPRGVPLKQQLVQELYGKQRLLILCGHYEGVDERVVNLDFDTEISVGDYILSGGEIAAASLIDAVARYIPGVLGNEQATDDESFSDGKLEYPQYTRPQNFMGLIVPEVLVSGDHAEVDKWRRKESERITRNRRPDLWENK